MKNTPKFTGKNAETIDEYTKYMTLTGFKSTTIYSKLWIIKALVKHMDNKNFAEIDKDDIEAYIIDRRSRLKPKTVHNDIVDLRLFFKWFTPDNTFFEGIKTKQPKNRLPTTALLRQEDVVQMLTACENQRDRAFISILWDSGARVGEILNLNVRDAQVDKYGAVVVVDGKTGMRRLRVIDSVPDLQMWLNQHPQRSNPDAPLFVTSRKYGGQPQRLDIRTVQNLVKTLAEHAGIKKNVHCHGFRHGRLTDLVKLGFKESELRIIAGWSDESNMPAVYIHMSGDDVESKMLAAHGIIEESKKEVKDNLQPIVCPRCKTKNAHDAQYCSTCSMILDMKLANDVEDTTQKIPDVLTMLLSDPDKMKMLSEKLNEMKK